MNTSFFHHVSIEGALAAGWDFEEDLSTWSAGKPYLSGVVWSIGEVEVTELDVLQAANSIVTTSLREFFTRVYNRLPTDTGSNIALLSSCHSGSSDYLSVGDIEELLSEGEQNAANQFTSKSVSS